MDALSYLLGKKSGGGGGTSNYADLTNKPSINSVELVGNKSLADLGILPSNVYLIKENSENNPFIFTDHDVGIYYFLNSNENGKNIYMKTTSSSQSIGHVLSFPTSCIIYYDKINEDDIITAKQFALFTPNFLLKTPSDFYGYCGYATIQRNNNGNINVYDTTNGETIINANLIQTITAKKYFNTLPESSIVPTTDNQLVNKKYVDDQIGAINTILATLTTPSNNGGGE